MAGENPFADAVNPFADAVNPFSSGGGFDDAVNPFEGAVNPFEAGAANEPEMGVMENLARGIGERAAQLGSGVLDFAADTGRNLEERMPLGGFIRDPEAQFGFRYADGEEYKQKVTPDSEYLEQGAAAAREADFGADPMVTPDDIKASWKEGNYGDVALQSMGFGAEQFIKSLPDMAAVLANAPAYITARTGELAQERAKELGDEQPGSLTQAAGGGAAIVSALLEKFGAEQVFGGSQVGESLLKTIMRGAASEGVTEAAQESIEYTGTKAGTGNFDLGEMGETAGWAALGGATGGGGMAGIQGTVDRLVGQPEADDGTADLEYELESMRQRDLDAQAQAAADAARARGGDDLDAQIAEMQVYMDGERATVRDMPTDPFIPPADGPDAPIPFNPYQQQMNPLELGGTAEDGMAQDNMLPYATEEPAGLSLMDNADVAPLTLAPQYDNQIEFDKPSVLDEKADTLALRAEQYGYDQAGPNREPLPPVTEEELGPPAIPARQEMEQATIAELNAAIKAAEKAMPPMPKGNSKTANEEMELSHAIASLGGLNRDEAAAQGIDSAEFGKQVGGIRRVFTKNGKTFDEMAEALSELGFFDGEEGYSPNALLTKLADSLSGNPVHSVRSQTAAERIGAQQQIDQIEQEIARLQSNYDEDQQSPPLGPNYTGLSDEERALSYTVMEAELAGVDPMTVDMILDEDISLAEIETKLRRNIDNAKGKRQGAAAPQGPDQGGREGYTAAPQSQGAQEEGGRQEARAENVGSSPSAQNVAPEATIAENSEPATDMFGAVPVAEQSVADLQREKDAKRNGAQDVPADIDGGLFSNQSQQIDITDEPSQPASSNRPAKPKADSINTAVTTLSNSMEQIAENLKPKSNAPAVKKTNLPTTGEPRDFANNKVFLKSAVEAMIGADAQARAAKVRAAIERGANDGAIIKAAGISNFNKNKIDADDSFPGDVRAKGQTLTITDRRNGGNTKVTLAGADLANRLRELYAPEAEAFGLEVVDQTKDTDLMDVTLSPEQAKIAERVAKNVAEMSKNQLAKTLAQIGIDPAGLTTEGLSQRIAIVRIVMDDMQQHESHQQWDDAISASKDWQQKQLIKAAGNIIDPRGAKIRTEVTFQPTTRELFQRLGKLVGMVERTEAEQAAFDKKQRDAKNSTKTTAEILKPTPDIQGEAVKAAPGLPGPMSAFAQRVMERFPNGGPLVMERDGIVVRGPDPAADKYRGNGLPYSARVEGEPSAYWGATPEAALANAQKGSTPAPKRKGKYPKESDFGFDPEFNEDKAKTKAEKRLKQAIDQKRKRLSGPQKEALWDYAAGRIGVDGTAQEKADYMAGLMGEPGSGLMWRVGRQEAADIAKNLVHPAYLAARKKNGDKRPDQLTEEMLEDIDMDEALNDERDFVAYQNLLNDPQRFEQSDHPFADWSDYETSFFAENPNPSQRAVVLGKDAPVLSQKEADATVAEWKAEAKRIGKEEDRSHQIVVSLFDTSGVMSQPWRDAGYTVIQKDIQQGNDILTESPGVTDYDLPDGIDPAKARVVGVIAQPPCTTFTLTANRWFEQYHNKDDQMMVYKTFGFSKSAVEYEFSRPIDYASMMVAATELYLDFENPSFYVLENPAGTRLTQLMGFADPTLKVQPSDFGHAYTKETGLWGNFNTDLPTAKVEAVEGSKMQNKIWSTAEKGKGDRSLTPEGMAYAIFMANNQPNEVELDGRSIEDKYNAQPDPEMDENLDDYRGSFRKGELTKTQQNGSLKHVDKNVRKAVLQTLKREYSQEAARIRKNLDDLAETPWAVTAIKGLAIREFFHLATEGKADSELANQILNSDIWGKAADAKMRNKSVIKAFMKGEKHVAALLSSYANILTDNKKAEKSISTSMKNCDPSRNCAEHCYDATGTGGNPDSIIKSELMEWAAEFYPELLADRIEGQYRASALGAAGLALRLNDKGDLSPSQVALTDEMAKRGIRMQIFSKRPELLRKVNPFHLRMLSADASNIEIAKANPDLQLAVTLTDDMTDAAMMDIAGRAAVILPVNLKGNEWSMNEIRARWPESYKLFKKAICPVEAGMTEVKAGTSFVEITQPGSNIRNESGKRVWTCTTCDKLGAIGCFYGANQTTVARANLIGTSDPAENQRLATINQIRLELAKLEKLGGMTREQSKKILAEISEGGSALSGAAKPGAEARAGEEYSEGDGNDSGRGAQVREGAEGAARVGEASGLTSEAVTSALAGVKDKWKAAPPIEIVQSVDDLPAEVTDEMARQGVDMVAGYFDRKNQKIYMVADGIQNKKDAQVTLLHEAVGHYGIESVMGREGINEFLRAVDGIKGTDKVVRDAYAYVDRVYDGASPLIKAAEVVAYISESDPKHNFVQRIIQMMRQLLRKAGFNVAFSNNDIIEALRRAKQNLESGKYQHVGGQGGLFQSALHGSSKRFQKFSLSKLGTGEGNKAFGWGLYFAQRESVAEYYKNLASGNDPENTRRIMVDGKHYTNYRPTGNGDFNDAMRLVEQHGTPEKAIAAAEADGVESYIIDKIRMLEGQRVEFDDPQPTMYKVEIPEDNELIDYDASLAEQPELMAKLDAEITKIVDEDHNGNIRLAPGWVQGIYEMLKWPNSTTGNALYYETADELGSDRAASMLFKAMGIPGLRFFDEQSRNQAPDVPEFTAWAGYYKGADLDNISAGEMAELRAEYQEFVNAEDTRTRNFVIFDEDRIEITDTLFRAADRGEPEKVDTGRREFLRKAGLATAGVITMAAGVKYRGTLPDLKLGKATPISEAAQQTVDKATNKLLRNGDLKGALAQIGETGPAELRALAKKLVSLIPDEGVSVTVDDRRKTNAHGSVAVNPLGGADMTLYAAEGRTGLSYGTILHESLHMAVMARYSSISTGYSPGNWETVGLTAPQSKEAMDKFVDLWHEFKRYVRTEDGDPIGVKEALRSPDEFFVRALTDRPFQLELAKLEYRGKSLMARFKDWVKTNLFLMKSSGITPSWLDAALMGANDFVDKMGMETADFAFADAVMDARSQNEIVDGDTHILFRAARQSPDSRENMNRRIREEHFTIWHKAKQQAKRYFAPGGLLPKDVFNAKIERDSELGALEMDVKSHVWALELAFKKDFKKSFEERTKAEERMMRDALAGRPSPDMPEATAVALEAMRQYIDAQSEQYIRVLEQDAVRLMDQLEPEQRDQLQQALLEEKFDGLNKTQAQIAQKILLMQTITGNAGEYVHRSYRAFDDPRWPANVPDAVLNAARDYLEARYLEDNPDASQREINAATQRVIESILKEDTAFDSLESYIRESKLGAKDLSLLKRRKVIAPEIRALLGEYADPRLNFAKTSTKMGRLIFNDAFLKKVLEVGMGEFLFEDGQQPEGHWKTIAGEGNESYAPLNGLKTTPEINQAFIDALGKEQMAQWFKVIVQLNGAVKFGKTVLSPTTAARNWMSALFFTVAQGHFDLTQIGKSLKSARSYFRHQGDELAYLRKLKQLGVVYDTPYAGEMMRLLDDTDLADRLLNGRMKARHMLDFAQKFYQFGDDFWKIVGFENEAALAMKHRGMTRAQAEVHAAERVRNTYPTYSMVGKGVNMLRRFPLAGTFVSFPAEIIRTTFNILKAAKEDMGHSKALGMRRLTGLALVSGLAYAAQEMSKQALGVDDDDEEAVREQLPPWSQNSNLYFLSREKGELRYLDLSFIDPYNYWKRPITALMRDEPFEDMAKAAAAEMLTPFFGTDIAFGAIAEVWNNKKGSGGTVYNMADTPTEQTLAIADHLRKALQPGALSNAERILKAARGERTTTGRQYEMDDELAALAGFRVSTLDPAVSLKYRTFEAADTLRNATSILSREARDPNPVDEEQLRETFDRVRGIEAETYDDLLKSIKAARKSGLDTPAVIRQLRAGGMSKKDAFQLANGRTPQRAKTSQYLKDVVTSAGDTYGEETQAEINRRRMEIIKWSREPREQARQ